MYLMYVDESGDCGLPSDNSNTRYFCLSGLIVHELRWSDTLFDLMQFRHVINRRYRIYLNDELHASAMINKPSATADSLKALRKYQRLEIIRHFADKIAYIPDISLINVVVDKYVTKAPNKDEVFRWAWYALFQRFENTIRYQNFPGPKNQDERGIVLPDNTNGRKLHQYLRMMRIKNPLTLKQNTGSHTFINQPVRAIIEDAVLRDSKESYFIQVVDCVAFLLKQFLEPCSYMKKHGGNAYFKRLEPVLCKYASHKDPEGLGIVRL